ncbi:MAG: hypothetical protein H7Z13_20200 [Ferruginibacter sp.]|nr:hypothetical protein [Ferruginibacter sp.]
MKNNSAQQEILLMTGTGFASRQYTEIDIPDNSKNLPRNEKLKEACWNGLLKEMLPEIFMPGDSATKLYLWQVREANQFFALEMGEYPTGVNKFLSIDPYRFMEVREDN